MFVDIVMGCSRIMGFLAGHETWKSSGDNVDGCHHCERGRTSGASDGRMLRPLLPGGRERSLIRVRAVSEKRELLLATVTALCGPH